MGGAVASVPIQSYGPQGLAKRVRQVRVQFAKPKVTFGDLRAKADLFRVECKLGEKSAPETKGSAKWIDERLWVYDFERELPGGLRCTVASTEGAPFGTGPSATSSFTFHTGGPFVGAIDPSEGGGIDEDQAFALRLDSPMASSEWKKAYFQIDGIGERLPVEVMPAGDLERVLKRSGLRRWAPEGKTWYYALIRSPRKFPAGKKVKLTLPRGMQGESGLENLSEQTFVYNVREAFRATFSCEREREEKGCLPISGMTLGLNRDVAWSELAGAHLRVVRGPQKGFAKGKKIFPRRPEELKVSKNPNVTALRFDAPFPPATEFELVLGKKTIVDSMGGSLANASSFPLAVRTEEAPPMVKFPKNFGILEWKPEAVLPVTVRAIEGTVPVNVGSLASRALRVKKPPMDGLRYWTKEVDRHQDRFYAAAPGDDLRARSVFREDKDRLAGMKAEKFDLPLPGGGKAFEVVGIPLKEPGFYVVEIESPRLGASLVPSGKPMFVSTTVLVTNLAVHLKQGLRSSVVWVTALDTGLPVSGAKVAIRDCGGAVLFESKTDADGLWRIEKPFPPKGICPGSTSIGVYDGQEDRFPMSGYYASAELGEDYAFTHTSWSQGIEPYRFGHYASDYAGVTSHILGGSVLARSLLRAGEKLQARHWVREEIDHGLGFPKAADLPEKIRFQHEGSGQEYLFDAAFKPDGSMVQEWTVPKEAAQGTYAIAYRRPKTKGDGYSDWISAGQFSVKEFKVPLARGKVLPKEARSVAREKVEATVQVEYLNGGAPAGASVTLRHQVRDRYFPAPPRFRDFSFGQGTPPKSSPWEESEESSSGDAPAAAIPKQTVKLDAQGFAEASFDVSQVAPGKSADSPRELVIDLEYRDPNGEVQTTSNRVELYASEAVVGLRTQSWVAEKKDVSFQAAVVDLAGEPLAGRKIQVDWWKREVYSYRKRIVGGFYAYENEVTLKRIGKACSGKTDDSGMVECLANPPESGNLYLVATAEDAKGRETTTFTSLWIPSEEGGWYYEPDNSDRMDLVPIAREVEPGAKAKFQVRMPFREARVLLTVEREGVMDARVVKLSGSDSIVEVPIEARYAPNVFVSALAVRGRVGDPAPTAIVDLGRPAFRLGIAEIDVGKKPFTLGVSITPSSESARVRETVKAKIVAKLPDGKPASGATAMVAVVDEGLLLIQPNLSWKIRDTLIQPRPLRVKTSTNNTWVIGKRHFGLKSLPAGGGAGGEFARELFDTLVYWNPSVTLDANGEAEVSFPLNDSLTSFRIAAVVVEGESKFGFSESNIRSVQPLILQSTVAQVARHGDLQKLEIRVRRMAGIAGEPTDARKIQVAARTLERRPSVGKPEFETSFALKPGESKSVVWTVPVPEKIETLEYEFTATSPDDPKLRDRVIQNQRILPTIPTRVIQATLERVSPRFSLPVETPADASKERSGFRVEVSPSVAVSLAGVERYFHGYPHTCLEQQVSRAVGLGDAKSLAAIGRKLPAYIAGDGLLMYFPTSSWPWGSDSLTVQVVDLFQEMNVPLPENVKSRLLEGLRGFIDGKIKPVSRVQTVDLALRRLSAAEAFSRFAPIPESFAVTLTIAPERWPTSALLDWLWILERHPSWKGATLWKQAAETQLRSRLTYRGTALGFHTEAQDTLWWLMRGPDTNGAQLMLYAIARADSKSGPFFAEKELGKTLRGALARHRKGHWDTTIANAWGALAVRKFVARFEKEAVDGKTQITVPSAGPSASTSASESRMLAWAKPPVAMDTTFWGGRKGTLEINHRGGGAPWAVVQSLAAIPLTQPLDSGIRLRKTVTAVDANGKSGAGVEKWNNGGVVRVRLEFDLQSQAAWVAISDPIPPGATVLGSGLGNQTSLLTATEKTSEGWYSGSPSYVEAGADTYRAYYEYLPNGKHSVEYTLRLNQSGRFVFPPTRAEAMYQPEIFGETPNPVWEIEGRAE